MRQGRNIEKMRGHDVVYVDGEWLMADTMKKTAEVWDKLPCGHCGKENTPEGHDGCVGTLPGVMNACCGHGAIGEAYVQFPNGRLMQKQEALDYINKHRDPLR
jgi:hypothetical protein